MRRFSGCRASCLYGVLFMERKITKQVQIGTVKIGNGNPIAVQSMLNQDTHDVEACLRQLRELAGQVAKLQGWQFMMRSAWSR